MSDLSKSLIDAARLRAAAAPDMPLGDGPALRNRRPWWRASQVPAALSLAVAMLSSVTAHAGDLLRGGAASRTPIAGKGAGGAMTTAGTSQAAANAKDALAKTTQALKAVQSMQAAAHKIALQNQQFSNVPNGLGPGGLQVASGAPKNLSKPVAGENPALWQGAKLPTQSVSQGHVTVDIVQTKPTAILGWNSFNVGKQTTVVFDQNKGGADKSKWIAFNEILSGSPSKILGSIEATGQVYIINQNGIIFGGSSQINVHTLVASTLPVNDNLIARGLLNNPDSQFLFSGLPMPAGTSTPAFTPLVTDPSFVVDGASPSYQLQQTVTTGATPSVAYFPTGSAAAKLVSGTDYLATKNGDGKTVLTFTASGLAKVGNLPVTVSYSSSSVRYGDVTVQAGANISSPTSADHVGGRVALIGANVTNAGTISTPDGQTILAAGLQVGVASHASGDPSLRGLDVYVGAVTDPASKLSAYAGSATNSGLIEAQHADVTIAGKAVNQLGFIDSSTSVSLNGRIDLLADYDAFSTPTLAFAGTPFLFKSTGTVTLGASSVSQILPELDSKETVVGTELALPSKVVMEGQAIHFASGATLLAPNASVTANAGVRKPDTSNSSKPLSPLVYSGGQIYLDAGATINVAGSTDISAPMSENIISAELRGSELADSPLERDTFIHGLTIQVDAREAGRFADGTVWFGTPLANVSGVIGLIKRTVGELTTDGGTVNLNAGSSVVVQSGAKIDVSGGWINYEGGMVETTRLVSNGVIFDISQATPDRIYDGIYTGTSTVTSPKYGLSQTFTNPLTLSGAHFEPSYVQGANGGTISITAPAMALDGTLLGKTVAGPRQRSVAPLSSTLSLAFHGQEAKLRPNDNNYLANSATPPNIVFQAGVSVPPVGAFTVDSSGKPESLPAARLSDVYLSPELTTTDGFGNLFVDNSDGTITVPSKVTLQSPSDRSSLNDAGQVTPGGRITLYGANLDIEGTVKAPGGALTFRTFDISPTEDKFISDSAGTKLVIPPPNLGRGNFVLGGDATLDTAGLIVDDRPSAATAGTLPFVTNGGSVTIASYSANLASGSTIDVSGGASISANGKWTYGDAGSISISTGQDFNGVQFTLHSVLGGTLKLESTLLGFAGGRGGSLAIQASQIQIGGVAASPNTVLLDPSFFSQGGFGSFSLTGLGVPGGDVGKFLPGVVIAPDTTIAPVAESLIGMSDANGTPTLTPILKPEGQRTPVHLAFNSPTILKDYVNSVLITRGDIVMEQGSVIRTDPLGGVSMSGSTVEVLGSIFAPGGSISISGATTNTGLLFGKSADEALATVVIGPDSVLSTAGTTIFTPDPRGFRAGTVLPGGTISITGNIFAEAGAKLDVSGATATLDLPPAMSTAVSAGNGSLVGETAPPVGSFGGSLRVPTRVDSDAGSIALNGGELLVTDATLLGLPGGPSAKGGSLDISSDHFAAEGVVKTEADIDITVTASGQISGASHGTSNIGAPVLSLNGTVLNGGHISVGSFATGGFDSVGLHNTVKFSGPVTLSATSNLTVADAGVLYADSAVTLNAPHVTLGRNFQEPTPVSKQEPPFGSGKDAIPIPPTFGDGSLTVHASLIDIGTLTLQGIGSANFVAADGDVRGDGFLEVAGKISITAGQVYVPTATSFTIAASDYTLDGKTHLGSVTINSSGSRELPLSAGGQLSVYGSIINQRGVLRAPFGSITLGWDGTGTAPIDPVTNKPYAVTQKVTLANGSITSVSAVDPVTGQALVIPYGLNLNGVSWIDPVGSDITLTGGPAKGITIAGLSVLDQAGSHIDISGGGDLYSYRFVAGVGGSKDILSSTTSFAIVPGYQADYAPYAPNSSNPVVKDIFGSDPGYVNSGLTVGSEIYLGASSGLPAGVYTLLPARYALLPGAFLVTPRSGMPVGTQALPDGSSIVSGYRFNGLNASQASPTLASSFEVDPASVVRARSQFDDFMADSFFTEAAASHDQSVPRLPVDAGHLVLSAVNSMVLKGSVTAQAPLGGRAGLVDISSANDILISGAGHSSGSGALVLDASELSSFGADSLLIGGIRTITTNGVTVSVKTPNITVDNAGTPLSAPDLILAANKSLTLAPGAEVEQSGTLTSPAETLLLGTASVAGSGDGVLLRVSSDPKATIVRSGVDASATPSMVIGAGAQISGVSLTLDSTHATSLDPKATLDAQVVSLNSGQISIQLNDPGALQPTVGLVLSGQALQSLETSATSLSLLSYSSIDVYGTGQVGSPDFANLGLHASEIRGFNTNGGTVTFAAKNISLDNSSGGLPVTASSTLDGTLAFNAASIQLGVNQLQVAQYASVELNASSGIFFHGTGGFSTAGALTLTTPVLSGAHLASQTITAGGALVIQPPAGGGTHAATGDLGASLTLVGATVSEAGNIVLPSGQLTLHATTGDLTIGGKLDVGGTAQSFFDLVKYTDGGTISLIADQGSVTLSDGSSINVSADPGGGSAGNVSISAPGGVFTANGKLSGRGGAGGDAGSLSIDVGHLSGGSVAELANILDAGGFSKAVSIRDRLDSTVLVDSTIRVHSFNLSADQGRIDVTGTIDTHGATGGSIALEAFGDVTLESGADLTVAGDHLDDAGEGGSISLETTHGKISIGAGSTMDLSVGSGAGGTLHLRAPQIAGPNFVAVDPLAGTITNASSIVVEGFFAQDANNTGTASIDSFEAAALANATSFMSHAAAIQSRLLAGAPGLSDVFHVRPGEEIDNSKGNLVLNQDLDLSTWRFGAQKETVDSLGDTISVGIEPGILTLRAKGSITFNGAINDGFGDSAGNIPVTDDAVTPALWKETLLPLFSDGTSQQSWSYRIAAGADLGAVDFRQTKAGAGSVLLGVDGGTNAAKPPGPNATSDSALAGHYQVIRTGAGSIDIFSGGDVKLLNQFATVYTAGTLVPDQTLGGNFDLPQLFTDEGEAVPLYPAQYSAGGGNVTIQAGGDIIHRTKTATGVEIDDSERELPTNWLYRRGYVDPLTGEFGAALFGDTASTTWWIDFSNFFEGVGALGGGNVSLIAGHDVKNVDAVVPTNARMLKGVPDLANLVELGGGDLVVQAGHDINAGVYYIERGHGQIDAGHEILTNSTRSPSLTNLAGQAPLSEQSWLPTTLFLGKGGFDISARGAILMGPVANPFLMPQGSGNDFWYKTYFSTYGADDFVNVTSLGGAITLRESADASPTTPQSPRSILGLWLQNVLDLSTQNPSSFQPWLRLTETTTSPFLTAPQLMPGTLRVTAYSGDINLVGSLTLSPTASGTVDLLTNGALNALNIDGHGIVNNVQTSFWTAGTLNLSDANPDAIPGVASPFAYQSIPGVGLDVRQLKSTGLGAGKGFLVFLDNLFVESGSTQTVLQTKQALHAPGILHLEDADPIHLYAVGGDVSGLELFSPKAARVIAGRDIDDIALYIQNDTEADVSVVAAGRDVVAYDANSPLRVQAQAPGNFVETTGTALATNPNLAGDIQIGGPGALEVLAGRNLDLGIGPNNLDRTGVGISSIGNGRNPNLPFAGAEIFAGAGIGPSTGLASSSLDFTNFISQFLQGGDGDRYLSDLASLPGQAPGQKLTAATFDQLDPDAKARLALDLFFLVLRDAGRDHSDPASSGFGNFDAGFAAIQALFPSPGQGDISLTSREIKTQSGGNIDLFAPGGGLTVGFDITGNQALDQGILTEDGGNISIFTDKSVVVGTSRIFTLRGGNEVIWSSKGDIAAGASSKTVQSAPPTRVLIDPQSGDVQTDLAGLATGGGIGVLETVTGVPPGDVDLIAPTGVIDAGDAGIRVSGNLNLAAVQILNASNISVGGSSVGTPAAVSVSAPNIGSLTTASNAQAQSAKAGEEVAKANHPPVQQDETPSDISVTVLGYGGGEGASDTTAAPADQTTAPETTSPGDTNGSGDDEEKRKHHGQTSGQVEDTSENH